MSILPTTKTPMQSDYSKLGTLIYGKPKIGKSSLAAEFPKAIFLPTEPGLNHLEVFQAPGDGSGVRSWDQLLQILAQLLKPDAEHDFETIIIDTIDNAYKLCTEWVCKPLKVKHIADIGGHGKGYGLVNIEFERVIRGILHSQMGLVMISHHKNVTLQTQLGAEYSQAQPTLTGGPSKIVTGLSDLILFVTDELVEDDKGVQCSRRVIKTKNSQAWMAGDRTGRLPETLPLSFKALDKSFRGALEVTAENVETEAENFDNTGDKETQTTEDAETVS